MSIDRSDQSLSFYKRLRA